MTLRPNTETKHQNSLPKTIFLRLLMCANEGETKNLNLNTFNLDNHVYHSQMILYVIVFSAVTVCLNPDLKSKGKEKTFMGRIHKHCFMLDPSGSHAMSESKKVVMDHFMVHGGEEWGAEGCSCDHSRRFD